jgi:phage tail-like protein
MPDGFQAMPANIAERLLALLPGIYQEEPFIGRYLWAFEQVLLSLEAQIDGLATLFDPLETRAEFLPWLSSWVAFVLRADLPIDQQRAFLARIVPLYRRRGTKQNLQELLSIFTHGVPAIREASAPMQTGVTSRIGLDTYLGGGPAHYFHVTMRLPKAEPEVQLRQSAIARGLIDLEKPAHTYYDLDIVFPTMQLGKSSTIGVDTLLGTGTDT